MDLDPLQVFVDPGGRGGTCQDVHLGAILQATGQVVRVRSDSPPRRQKLRCEDTHLHAVSPRKSTPDCEARGTTSPPRFSRRVSRRHAMSIPVRRGTSFGSPIRREYSTANSRLPAPTSHAAA